MPHWNRLARLATSGHELAYRCLLQINGMAGKPQEHVTFSEDPHQLLSAVYEKNCAAICLAHASQDFDQAGLGIHDQRRMADHATEGSLAQGIQDPEDLDTPLGEFGRFRPGEAPLTFLPMTLGYCCCFQGRLERVGKQTSLTVMRADYVPNIMAQRTTG
jgi:hypothetical protein